MHTFEWKEQTSQKDKRMAIKISEYALEKMEFDREKTCVILCEGTWTSVDVALYSKAYEDAVVIPANGCTELIKLLPRVKKLLPEIDCYGIIDRDALSKKEIEELSKKQDIFTTKLPFIENIICTPEVLKILCKRFGIRYESVISELRERLINLLNEQIRTKLPINIFLSHATSIKAICIDMYTDDRIIHKHVDLNNITYTFRDKSIVSIVATILGLNSKSNYYKKIIELLNDEEIGENLLRRMMVYLPRIKITDE